MLRTRLFREVKLIKMRRKKMTMITRMTMITTMKEKRRINKKLKQLLC